VRRGRKGWIAYRSDAQPAGPGGGVNRPSRVMKVIKPQTLSLLTRPFEFRRQFWLGCAAIAFLPIGETPALLPETAMWPFLSEELPPDQPLDAVIPKVLTEVVAIAHAYAPGGTPVPLVEVGIQLGPLIKMLSVCGDRLLNRSQVTRPVPFATMPIDWKHAFGGKGFADNPIGKGAAPIDGTDGQIRAVPNVVDPLLDREAHRTPSSFAPVAQMWPARAQMAGTYDDTWLKQDFPGFPRDIDWRFFNIAPWDQWLPNWLAGDETYAFKNLHPAQPLLRGRLPGMAPRLFVIRKGQEDDSFEEIPLTLTTIWCFPHRERLVLVHHGQARLAEEDGSDIARIVLGADRLGALRPVEDFRGVMVKRMDRKDGAFYALRDQDLVLAELLPPAVTNADAAPSPLQQILARNVRRAERESAASRDKMRALGLDPDKFLSPPPPPPVLTMPTLEELPAIMAAAEAQAKAEKEKAEAAATAKKAEAAAQLAASGMPDEEIKKLLDGKPKGPPTFSVATMQSQIDAIRATGHLTPEAELQLASPETIAQLRTAEREIRNSYRLTAQHQDRADTLPAERSAEIRRLVSGDAADARALYDLHGADLSGLDLSGIDLSGVCMDGANLTGTSFANAKLVNAVLAHSRMEGCVLDGADLTGANLGKARFLGATFDRATLRKAVLAGADLTNASLVGADLEGADLTDTITAGADFSNVRASGVLAIKLSLRGFHAAGIVLTKAKFIECDLEHANLADAALEQAVFLECNLANARFSGARLRKAVFVKQCSLANADLSGADLTEANLRETDLRGANLDGANIERADLSGADLTGAVLTRVCAIGSRLIAADLRQADLSFANFSNADLSRADLRGADLTEVSVYEANLPRTKLDRDTRRSGMFRTRVRYLPVYEPPKEAAS
jgi:uncharacterized protein YjbI with pentapeptide repeats